ncbi:MAG TPA: hypothetical protein PKC28_07300 [Bdellovibrionales bacterium]|nr:hypothetical protein [Bdellovibrionales bacterium]
MKTREIGFAFAAVTAGLALVVLVLWAAGFLVRGLPLLYRDAEFAGDMSPLEPVSGLALPIDVEPKRFEPRPQELKPAHGTHLPRGFVGQDGDGISWLLPNAKGRSYKNTLSGEKVYDVFYETDAEARRRTPGQGEPTRTKPFLFLGCSFVFGDGVEQDQTLAAAASRLEKNYRFYNYGMLGIGPGNLLRRVRMPEFGRDLPRAGGKAVYLMMDHHLNRVVGSLDIYQNSFNWDRGLPEFTLSRDGALIDHGSFAQARPVLGRLYRALGRLDVLTYFQVNFPRRFGRGHSELFAAIVRELGKELERGFNLDFYTVIYPGGRVGHRLVPFLNAAGVRTLDYSAVNLTEHMAESPSLADGHPSPAAHEFVAAQILKDLKL